MNRYNYLNNYKRPHIFPALSIGDRIIMTPEYMKSLHITESLRGIIIKDLGKSGGDTSERWHVRWEGNQEGRIAGPEPYKHLVLRA